MSLNSLKLYAGLLRLDYLEKKSIKFIKEQSNFLLSK